MHFTRRKYECVGFTGASRDKGLQQTLHEMPAILRFANLSCARTP